MMAPQEVLRKAAPAQETAFPKRQVLLVCDFGPAFPSFLLSVYEKMGDAEVTLLRRKYGSLASTQLRIIQIPLTTRLGLQGKGSALRDAVNALAYLVVGSAVGVVAAVKHRCTVVHSHFLFPQGLVGMIAAFFSRSAFVATAVGSDVNAYGKHALMRGVIRTLASRGTVVSISLPIKDRLSSIGVQSVYIPSYVDGEKFRFREAGEKEDLLLFVGSLTEIKRPDLLVEGLGRIRRESLPAGFHASMVGWGHLEPQVRGLVAARGLQRTISLEGSVSHDSVRDFMARALVYVSTSSMEGTSFALIEAMASGCVVIASDAPGNCAVVKDHQNGLLFRRGDPGGLALAIEEVLGDRALAAKLSRNARATFESNFDIKKCAGLLSNLYDRVDGRGPARGPRQPP